MTEEHFDYIGHRQRLRQRFLLGEGRDMADYELLELVLTYAIPRRDVKPIAKKLIAKFGNFANVITAPEHKLEEVIGIKENSITLLKLIRTSSQRLCWQNLESEDKPVLFNIDTLIDYCRSTIAYSEVEELYLLYLVVKLKIIDKYLL